MIQAPRDWHGRDGVGATVTRFAWIPRLRDSCSATSRSATVTRFAWIARRVHFGSGERAFRAFDLGQRTRVAIALSDAAWAAQ